MAPLWKSAPRLRKFTQHPGGNNTLKLEGGEISAVIRILEA